MSVDDGIEAQIRSLANEPKFKLAAAYLIKHIERQDHDMDTKRRTPHEATAHLLELLSRQALAASKIAAQYSEDRHLMINHDIDMAIQGLKVGIETISDHHQRTRGDRRMTG